MEKCIKYFIVDGILVESYDLWTGSPSPFFSPWSAGLLETFLEMRDDYPQLDDIVVEVVGRWLKNKFYEREGLSPFRSANRRPYYTLGALNARLGAFRDEHPRLRGYPHPIPSLGRRLAYGLRRARYIYASSGGGVVYDILQR